MFTWHAFLLTLRDTIVIFLFCFFFLCRPPSRICPTFSARCFSCPTGVFLVASSYFGSCSSHTEEHSGSYLQLPNVLWTEGSPALSFSVQSSILYISYLAAQKRAYSTILYHISSLKHAYQLTEYELTWSSDYRFQLLLRGTNRFLGQAVSRKSAITPSILHAAFDLFYFSIPLHATMWALFLVAFFTFLCKSNLVPDNPRQISPKVITCIGQIWSSPPQALIFMSQLLKPFSASSALLFCLFPRSLGLVFAPSLRYVAIYRSILVKARLPFLPFYRDRP